jgi:hypothetical protein
MRSNMNAVCERFLRSQRRECLDHVVVLDDGTSRASSPRTSATTTPRALTEGATSRPRSPQSTQPKGNIVALPLLSNLHHEYRRAA